MRRTSIDAMAAHPRRWAAQFGLALAGALIVIPLLAGRTPSITGAVATGIAVGIVFWGVGSLLQRQRDAAEQGAGVPQSRAGRDGLSTGTGRSPDGRTPSGAPIDQRQAS